jgi:hypothetical protein
MHDCRCVRQREIEPRRRREQAALMILRDASILLVVYALAGLYALTIHSWLVGRTDDRATPAPERFGLSIVLGVLLLAIANNYLSSLVGSIGAAVVVLALPLANLAVVAALPTWRARVLDALRATGWTIAAAAGMCTIFSLSIAYNLFTFQRLSADGTLYPDLPAHIGRTMQQAFQSTPGFLPLSPMAFPAPLPFSAFGADALISATFRYLPLQVHAFTYGQVLFAWVVVLLTAVILIADPHPSRGLGVLTITVLAVPLIAWRMGELPYIIFVLFHANPNSAITRPIGLAFAFHVYRAVSRKAPPSWPFLIFVPVASVYFKPNMTFTFGFLQVVGFAAWAWSRQPRGIVRAAIAAASVWILAIMLTFVDAVWAVSPAFHPSVENLWHYADIAIPALDHQRSVSRLLEIFGSDLAITAGIAAGAVLLRSRWTRVESIGRAMVREVAAPAIVLALAMVYLLVGWWFVVPVSTNGDPMHVNFDLIVTLMTPPLAIAICRLYDRDDLLPRWSGAHRVVTVAIGCAIAALWGGMAWRLTTQTANHGGLPLHFDYDIALETRLRQVLHPRIPDGHCFSYGRRFAVYVDGGFEPDFGMAATGCPVLNGDRWRGRLGENDSDALAHLSTISVPSGPPFRVVDVTPCSDPPGATNRLATAASESTVQLTWEPAAGAASYVIEVGSASGLSDIGRLTTHAATSLTASEVKTGTYFTRVRARNLCGVGAASNEVIVRVQ